MSTIISLTFDLLSFCMKFCKFVGNSYPHILQKLLDICKYELPTNLQNFAQKKLNRSENIPKSFRGATFLKQRVEVFERRSC